MEFYPARFFTASKSYNEWNRLSIKDVITLRTLAGLGFQQVYYYLNHPIQYVRVVGVVVDIEQFCEGKFTVLTIEDGSGESIEVRITARQGDDFAAPSNTTVDNVNAYVHLGLPLVKLNGCDVVVGSVVKVKATIRVFRKQKQLELKRLFFVNDTAAEMKAWEETAAWKRDVLGKPWKLTREEMREVDDKLRIEDERRFEKRKKTARYEQKLKERGLKKEQKRAAQEREFDAGALPGSSRLPLPW
ncbi:hypothetical protein K470DRAFT_271003 [Piedraia hortae CBS 480.64]|uniref:CST complex subunit Stn1 N-terminal domain-containing protein n=1 Tax=Piedraia hortae CBS 480.64 TaxID=1314780 RepID=A0A6A7BYE5_9PEZI|nr:hypothetical protein K470DRAFT_271003 [Piedraia hortae CBS 480.64]